MYSINFKKHDKLIMKKFWKKAANSDKGVLARLNDKSEEKKKVVPTSKKKGILSKMNDNPDQDKEVSGKKRWWSR